MSQPINPTTDPSHGQVVPYDALTWVIIAGYGLPGRYAAEVLHEHNIPYCVIEMNPATVDRCKTTDVTIYAGDAANPEVLRHAGIQKADLVIVAIPNDEVAIAVTRHARHMNPTCRILTRCHYTSTGLQTLREGAEAVIVDEQLVAREMSQFLRHRINTDQNAPLK